MPWLCVNKNRQEVILDIKPIRKETYWSEDKESIFGEEVGVDLPKGTIKKLIGKDLTWNDEPYELTEPQHKEEKLNWTVLLLSIIWALLIVIVSGYITEWKYRFLFAIPVVILIYFGYHEKST